MTPFQNNHLSLLFFDMINNNQSDFFHPILFNSIRTRQKTRKSSWPKTQAWPFFKSTIGEFSQIYLALLIISNGRSMAIGRLKSLLVIGRDASLMRNGYFTFFIWFPTACRLEINQEHLSTPITKIRSHLDLGLVRDSFDCLSVLPVRCGMQDLSRRHFFFHLEGQKRPQFYL